MKTGDLVRFKHFPDEHGIIVKIYVVDSGTKVGDVLGACGNVGIAHDLNLSLIHI